MERTPPIPVELWEQIPRRVQAVLWEVFDRYDARIAQLEAEVAELKEHRNQTSQNSSKPPSSECAVTRWTAKEMPVSRVGEPTPGELYY